MHEALEIEISIYIYVATFYYITIFWYQSSCSIIPRSCTLDRYDMRCFIPMHIDYNLIVVCIK